MPDIVIAHLRGTVEVQKIDLAVAGCAADQLAEHGARCIGDLGGHAAGDIVAGFAIGRHHFAGP